MQSPSAEWAPLVLALFHRWTKPGDVIPMPRGGLEPSGPASLADVVEGGGFQLRETRGSGAELVRRRTLPDVVGPGMRVLVCGLNPSVVAADAGFGYAGATNRFWRAARESGLLDIARDPIRALAADRVGMTDLVKRATPGAGVLTASEYRRGALRVERLVRWLRPRTVLLVGLSGWRAAFDPDADAGWQPGGFGGSQAYVMPSTSGRNAHATLGDLVAHMTIVARS